MEIKIAVKNVYGELKAYPACKTSEFFCKLMGTKTLTRQALRLIKAEGYEIVQVTGELIAV